MVNAKFSDVPSPDPSFLWNQNQAQHYVLSYSPGGGTGAKSAVSGKH